MRLRAPVRVPVLLAALTCAALVSAPPASAGTKTFRDQRGDVPSSNDILRTKVKNGDRIGVTITHRDLTRAAVDIQFTVKSRAGKGWTVFAALDGSYATLYRDGTTRDCPELKVSRSLGKDVTSLSVPRSCVDDPAGRIQLRPRVQWSADGAKGDWSINGHGGYTGWVKR